MFQGSSRIKRVYWCNPKKGIKTSKWQSFILHDIIIKDGKMLEKHPTIIIGIYGYEQLFLIDWMSWSEKKVPLDAKLSKLAVINANIVALFMRDIDYILIFDINNQLFTKFIVRKSI